MVKSGIYKITCLVDNSIYIGYSSDILSRKNKYENNHIKTQKLIKESIEKYGWLNHRFEIIEYCSKELLKEREIYWVSHYDSYNNGLNGNRGGGGPSEHTEESKLKISKNTKGIPKPGTSENMIGKPSRFKGKKHSDETIEKMKKPKPLDFGEKISKLKKGKPNIKLSEFKKGKPSSFKNHKHTEETKYLQSLSKKGKTYEEIYGLEKSIKLKQKRSLPRKGKTIECENDKKIFNSLKEAALFYNINPNSISNILSGFSKETLSGLTFKYVN